MDEMKWEKYKMLVSGIAIGALTTLSLNVYANISNEVTASLAPYIGIQFNGEEKQLPEGYSVLLYEGRTYTPARFVAEELGAEVFWDEASQMVRITSPEKENLVEEEIEEPTVDEDTEESGEEQEEKESTEDTDEEETRKVYDILPTTYYDGDIRLRVQTIVIDDDQTRVFVSLLNEGNIPVQLEQTATVITIDGKEYKQIDAAKRVVNPYVNVWYQDIKKDDNVDSLVRMPVIPEDTKELTIKFLVRENILTNAEEKEITFDIKL